MSHGAQATDENVHAALPKLTPRPPRTTVCLARNIRALGELRAARDPPIETASLVQSARPSCALAQHEERARAALTASSFAMNVD